jgi:Putative peptidoglycan binding domain
VTLVFVLAGALGASASTASVHRKSLKKHSSHVTSAKLHRSYAPKHRRKRRYYRRRRYRGQKAPTPERISEIQTALSKDGSYTGEPTGKLDANTSDALRKFQAAHGLTPTGKLDALTLQKLGLGSETAGIAPPLPVTGPASGDPVAPPPPITQRN